MINITNEIKDQWLHKNDHTQLKMYNYKTLVTGIENNGSQSILGNSILFDPND